MGNKIKYVDSTVSTLIPCKSLHGEIWDKFTACWLEGKFPIVSWGRIDWDKVDSKYIINYDDYEDQINKLKRLIKEKIKAHYVYVFWSSADLNPILVERSELVKNIAPIIDEGCDTWIIPADKNSEDWCIEVYHEGEICFGYSPFNKKCP